MQYLPGATIPPVFEGLETANVNIMCYAFSKENRKTDPKRKARKHGGLLSEPRRAVRMEPSIFVLETPVALPPFTSKRDDDRSTSWVGFAHSLSALRSTVAGPMIQVVSVLYLVCKRSNSAIDSHANILLVSSY